MFTTIRFMRDYDIRHSLHNQFLAHFRQDGESVVVDELGVCNGRSVIDVAVINGSLHAFEIKSDFDTLARLPKQAEDYSRVFDFVTIVVNAKYANRVIPLIPEWWGIWQIFRQNDEIIKKTIRQPTRNPSIDAFSVAQLLWKEEAIDYLEKIGHAKGYRTKRRWLLWEKLAETVPLPDLCESVRFYLKQRPAWKPSRFVEKEAEPVS